MRIELRIGQDCTSLNEEMLEIVKNNTMMKLTITKIARNYKITKCENKNPQN